MNLLIALLLFLLFFSAGESNDATGPVSAIETQRCTATSDGVGRCGPVLIGGLYQVPDAGPVILARVNNGAVSPESQVGYAIAVDADGTVTITEMSAASSRDQSEDEPDARQTVRTEQIGDAGVQELLSRLDSCGYYYLTQRNEVDPAQLPDGGEISAIEVSLVDGHWEVLNQALLDDEEFDRLAACQEDLASRFGVGIAV